MRVGSTWLCDLIAGIMKTPWSFWERGRDIPKEKFENFIKNSRGKNIIKMHYTPPQRICECIQKGDKNNYVISITRDVRDIAISKILYMKHDKPMRNLAHLKSLNDMRVNFDQKHLSDKDYINEFIKTPHFRHIVKNWKIYNDGFEHPNYHLTSYEILWRRRLLVCKTIADFLGISSNNKGLRQVIVKNNFRSKSGRKNGEEVNSAFRRKGIIGDYKNYLNAQSLRIIDRLIESHD
jgi:hypothetical protein